MEFVQRQMTALSQELVQVLEYVQVVGVVPAPEAARMLEIVRDIETVRELEVAWLLEVVQMPLLKSSTDLDPEPEDVIVSTSQSIAESRE